MMWSNRLLENREAVAEQLYGTAGIMEAAASLTYEVRPVDAGLEKQMDIKLRMHGIVMREMWDVRCGQAGAVYHHAFFAEGTLHFYQGNCRRGF